MTRGIQLIYFSHLRSPLPPLSSLIPSYLSYRFYINVNIWFYCLCKCLTIFSQLWKSIRLSFSNQYNRLLYVQIFINLNYNHTIKTSCLQDDKLYILTTGIIYSLNFSLVKKPLYRNLLYSWETVLATY